jgi:hypothetical protein
LPSDNWLASSGASLFPSNDEVTTMRKLKEFLARLVRRGLHVPVAAALAFVATGGVALALTNPPTFAPRLFTWQMTHYERHVVSLTSTNMTVDGLYSCNWNASTPFTCAVKVAALPYNAFVVRIYMQVTTACTTSTACGLAMGTGNIASGNSQNLMATSSILVAGGSVQQTVVAANAGITVTGNGTTQSGTDGGFDLWITGTATVAQPGAGTAVLVLEYFAPNDGGCAPVPMGSTAGAC